MTHEPPFSKSDQKAAEELILEKKVKNVLFSEGTYQIEIEDPKSKKVFWPFLQLDDRGRVLDCFCTCAQAEKRKSCPHLAAALLEIFKGKPDALHLRFRDSFWNQLCQIASRRHGYDATVLRVGEDDLYEALSKTGKRLFYIQSKNAKGKQKLKEILLNRAPETEETSLKFSNLSTEELSLWRQGRPSHALRYELSFWSDLAKWCMFLQEEKEPYRIEFSYEEHPLPKWISVHFSQIEMGLYVAEVNWPILIPSLSTVKSSLTVHEFAYQMIDRIVYDELAKGFSIQFINHAKSVDVQALKPTAPAVCEVGDWLFIPHQGFYPARMDPLLKENWIPSNKVSTLLNKQLKVVQKYLVDTKVHPGSIKARYELSFDESHCLFIKCYVFEPGDLQHPQSAYFGSWVYIAGKGFYQIENQLFEGVQKVIPKALVSDFVNRHRLWLNSYEGFQTHLSSMETHLSYSLSELGLRFETKMDFGEESTEIIDFGDWIYVQGRGFYAKMTSRTGTLIRAGNLIPPYEISRFIDEHKDELENIKDFFSEKTPLEKSGLSVFLNERGQIVVRPEYTFQSPYSSAQIQFFGDYMYVQKEGFCAIEPQFRLPDSYVREKVIDPLSEPYFVAYELDLLRPFLFHIDSKLCKPKDFFLRIEKIKKDPKSPGGMWLLELSYETEIGSVSPFELWHGLQEQKRYLFTQAGLIFLKQTRFQWLKNLPKRKWLKKGKQLRLSTLEWLRLCVFEDIREPKGESRDAIASRKLLEELKSFHTDQAIDLDGLKSHLRAYQETGLRWLWFLYCHGLSGLLCDEMGLGKTHQAMALLAASMNAFRKQEQHVDSQGPKYLVVCPTSVIYHWEELLKNFFPKMRVLVFYGIQRSLEKFSSSYDLLLTSYGTFRSEKKELEKIGFEIAIFDETQIAKNVQSQTHRALRAVNSKMRLGLTGTPIENRLLELKALFDLVLPTYFPTEAVFRETFVNPIEKNQDPEKKALLSRLVKPFILRRKKAEVLLELPEKIEEIAYCDLSLEQKELYRMVYLQHKEALLREIQEEGKPLPYLHIFSLLSTFKQICDHPCLHLKNPQDYRKHESGKWDLFVELLQETRDSGQKLVVFSQYLDMLDIIEAHLLEKGIGFAGIRGSTRNRKQQLDKFREDPTCEVFVASLQAAGVGVDLVAASVVIHYDRWWNPAKENQATDRVHRIGQRRGVQVFKLVTKGTIEEHIHLLIEKKMQLLEGVIGFDEQDHIKGLTREELLEVIKLLNAEVEGETKGEFLR